MSKVLDQYRQFPSYIYKLQTVQYADQVLPRYDATLHSLLLFKEAKGQIIINGNRYDLHQQKVFLVPPHASLKIMIESDSRTEYYILSFHVLQPDGQGHFVPIELLGLYELHVAHFRWFADRVREIQDKHDQENLWDQMKANVIFQELLIHLFKEDAQEQKPDMNQAIAATLDHMEQHYATSITRNQLAEIAGMSADYYSRAFKKVVGKSPMEHLTEIRITQSKQVLLLSNDSFRSVAQQVGFSDEFYFSRKFKAVTGRSPKSYIHNIRYSNKIASLKHLLTGHLVALGIEPYAAVINNAYPITTQFEHTIPIGDNKPDLEKLMNAQPDLIVTCEFRDFEKSQKEKMYEQIAPTITLPFFEDWRVHFQTIARIVGKDQEAQVWLEQYADIAQLLRQQLKNKFGQRSLLILGVGESKICIYGKRNLGSVLYNDLGFIMPAGVENIAHYYEIQPEELIHYDADCILMTPFQHDGTVGMQAGIEQGIFRLCADPLWQRLQAVQTQSVYEMYTTQHMHTCYNSYSHLMLLEKVRQLFLDKNDK
ncbi:ABC transporter substrate-binding protein [Paenibacillus sp. PK4536]|uniref:ABC transporter substrate-binding protein n=1 Tax=Paenibacillus sp. PK4536 TaxID=3024576 RepID=UPI00235838CF|nr:ABC transporter substrate-binding protein [Paenibacillus sp. PK4536]WIM38166.1 ABC transporter substrate-binding protein [Paenibacillus sp. PK4536]